MRRFVRGIAGMSVNGRGDTRERERVASLQERQMPSEDISTRLIWKHKSGAPGRI
jgi:hypothetical protein